MSTRAASIRGYGGDPASPLVASIFADWSRGADFSAAFNEWVKSIPDYPSPLGFKLSSVVSLFAGKQADIMHQAYLAYAGAFLSVTIEPPKPNQYITPSVTWRGKVLTLPPPPSGSPVKSGETLNPLWILIDQRTAAIQAIPGDFTNKIPDAVKNKKDPALVFYCTSLGNFFGGVYEISDPLYAFLRSCGAGKALDAANKSAEGTYQLGIYSLAGRLGSGPNTAIEIDTVHYVYNKANWQLLHIDVPVVPEWDGHNMLYNFLDW